MVFRFGDKVSVNFDVDSSKYSIPNTTYDKIQIGKFIKETEEDYLIEFDHQFSDELHNGGDGSGNKRWYCDKSLVSPFHEVGVDLSKFKYPIGSSQYFGMVYGTCKIAAYGKRGNELFYIVENRNGGSVGSDMVIIKGSTSGSCYIYMGLDEVIEQEPKLPDWVKIKMGTKVNFSDSLTSGVGRVVGYDRPNKMYAVESDDIPKNNIHIWGPDEFVVPPLPYDENKVRGFYASEVSLYEESPVDNKPSWAKYDLGDMVECNCRHARLNGIGKVVAYLDLNSYLIEGDFIVGDAGPGALDSIIGTPLPYDKNKIKRFWADDVSPIRIKPIACDMSPVDDQSDSLTDAMISIHKKIYDGEATIRMQKARYSPEKSDDDLLRSPVIIQKINKGVSKIIITDFF